MNPDLFLCLSKSMQNFDVGPKTGEQKGTKTELKRDILKEKVQ